MTTYQRKEEFDGGHVLYLGDCLEILPTLEPQSVDVLWTDPPYGNCNNNGDLNSMLATGAIDGRAVSAPIAIANDQPDTMRLVVDGMLREASRVLKRDSCCCCCCGGGGPYPTFAWLAQRMDEHGLSFFHSIIWDKINPGLGWRYRRQHEMVMIAHRRGGRLRWADQKRAVGNIIRASNVQQRVHPNEKPGFVVDWFLANHACAGDAVLDPFMGSGVTGAAAIRRGCRFIGIELEEKYFDIACRRMEQALKVQETVLPGFEPTKPVQEALL